MHCPNCRSDNAATTRFCTSCGAVLVEEAPGGGRRRILRPWGLRNSAPPTVSPDFPDLAVSPILAERRAWRVDIGFAGAIAAIVVLVAALYPWLQRADAEPSSRVDERTVALPAPVVAPAVAIAQEARLSAPALVERVPPQALAETGRTRAAGTSSVGAPSRPVAARGLPATPVSYAMPSREGVIADGQGTEAPPTPAPPPAAAPSIEPDRWQVLRAELNGCQPLGVFERATCEQQARLAHCDSYWGHVALCPPLLADSRR
jgi:hypothetical protein